MRITNDIRYVGVNDHDLDLFEGLYPVPEGVSYNSYVIMDEKIAVMDAVDASFGGTWLTNVRKVLNGNQPDFLIVHHMEPDHSASIALFMDAFPEAVIVSSQKSFPMMKAFFGADYANRRIIVKEGDMLSLGRHSLTFISAPMVHWPEVIMTYDQTDKALFTADAFGKFGALDIEDDWACEARRYYFGIVGKYGAQVQSVLKKVAALNIGTICPLHGPVLQGQQLTEALRLYDIWSSYLPEDEGVVIAHASVYGNTRAAAEKLAEALREKGVMVTLHDLTRCDIAEAVEDAFRYDRLVLAAATYNADVFPPMRNFITWLTERGYRSRRIGLIENGSWAPMAAKVMRGLLEGSRDLTILEPVVKIQSALNEDSTAQLLTLADALV
ncbi:MAG: FprA family A-type flavoprotein [Clostridiales bacterium]|nr:FprA family A-type flavoprotein [Clostridiales bacterium]